jgi:SRSO17 transposase
MKFASDYNVFFNVARRNVSDKARNYLQGLLMKAPRKNMERMEEYVEEYDYQGQQQFLSDSPWSHEALMEQVARDTATLLGGQQSALLIDESAFGKKGEKSAGVARQWNGRLGKVDNAQVGVFAALSDGRGGGLIDGRLYLPESWTEDEERCLKAKIPPSQRTYRSKPQLALEMIARAVETGVKFGWVGFDAFYGSTPWLLRQVEDMGLVFVGDVRSNATVYCEDPAPYLPRRSSGSRGRRFTQRRHRGESTTMAELFSEEDCAWKEVRIREGTKGVLRVSASAKRVWLWDGEEKEARQWWAVCVVDEQAEETKFFLSNAPGETSLEELVGKHAVRYWIERTFQDAKTSLGMADYQAQGWPAWHHHMAMVMLAMLFLLRERRVHLVEVEMLSCQDIVELLNVFIPRRDLSPEAVIRNIERRHRKRREASEAARRSAEARYHEFCKLSNGPDAVLTL